MALQLVDVAFEATPSEIATFARTVTAEVPWALWKQRVDGLSSLLRANPIWEPYLLERHALEFALEHVHRHLRNTGRYTWPPQTAEEYHLYSFLAVAASTIGHLTPPARARFVGSIKRGLEKEIGLGPIAFELKTIAHLAARGFRIGFHDLEEGGGYDFLAAKGSDEIEVECKFVSGDIGRKVHRRTVVALGGLLQSILARDVDRSSGGRITTVVLPDRLSKNAADQVKLALQIQNKLEQGMDGGPESIATREFSLIGSPFEGRSPNLESIRGYLEQTHGLHNSNIVAQWRPQKSASIVVIESAKPDTVTESIWRRLKGDAKRQFSGTRPALMCVQLADLAEAQLQGLADTEQGGTPTALQRIASLVLDARPHLHSIAFATTGEVKQSASPTGRLSIREQGKSYVFANPHHPQANNPGLSQMFR